ncbi:MAG: phosphatase PAP2 family protein [Ruminococcaceae bacterium]|nr:phosphatase PAP2 family protein [Oscillospiraceae bacterium]
MGKKHYQKRHDKIKRNANALKLLKALYKILPLIVIITYPVMLIIKFFSGFDSDFLLMICVPAGTLLIVTALRKLIDRERPYIKHNTEPLIPKKSTGESFPSRHTASAFIIAMSAFLLSPILACCLLIIATIIAITRILAGVHYLTDVLAGMLISIGIGTVFFIII